MKTYICCVCRNSALNEDHIMPEGWFRHAKDSSAEFPMCSEPCMTKFMEKGIEIDSNDPAKIAQGFSAVQ
jgi:hypothetical protein